VRIDLHTHSTASDGTDSPAELIRNAAACGLDVVALTDHDTVGGYAQAAAALDGTSLTLVTGAELSCRIDGISMHMLAYLFDPAEPRLYEARELVRDGRVPRARGMIDKLQALGVPVTWEMVRRIAGDGSVGRPHIATAMVELGIVATVSDAFTEEWLANDGRAYVDKHEFDPFEAVRLVKAAGGVTVFAHPGAHKRGETVPDEVIAALGSAGLDGLEVDHVDHDAPTRERLRGLTRELGLLATGSSDYHGARKTVALGECVTDPEVFAQITARATGAQPLSAV
jgi:predicted metal-dependent phosphoesterase TrpH